MASKLEKKSSATVKKVSKKEIQDYFDSRFIEVFGYGEGDHAFSSEYSWIQDLIDSRDIKSLADVDDQLDVYLESYLGNIAGWSEKPNATPQKEWDAIIIQNLKLDIEYAKQALKDYQDEIKSRPKK